MIRIARITIYPIKSLDGCDLPEANILPSGALAGDRQLRLVDERGKTVSVRNTRKLTTLRCEFELAASTVRLSIEGRSSEPLALEPGNSPLAGWLSEFLGQAINIEQDTSHGFPDDHEATGPTLLSQGTLQAIGRWFPELATEEIHRRMRANIVIDADQPYWEDRLVGDERAEPFLLGEVKMLGEKVCQRCVVPSLDSRTGEAVDGFAKQLSRYREDSLPDWSPRSRFDHFYRVAINTNIDPQQNAPATIAVGDQLTLAED